MAGHDRAAEQVADELHSVADAEHRNAQLEYIHRALRRLIRIHAVGTAGEDDAYRLHGSDLGYVGVVRENDRVHAAFADAPCDQFLVLSSEVEDHDGLIVHMIVLSSRLYQPRYVFRMFFAASMRGMRRSIACFSMYLCACSSLILR